MNNKVELSLINHISRSSRFANGIRITKSKFSVIISWGMETIESAMDTIHSPNYS